MTTVSNDYCRALGIGVPVLEAATPSADANFYALLLVALLERGAPMTLAEAAARFEQAGVAPVDEALASLKRCRPARPPIYRDGDHYALDPYDDEVGFWLFRLGLRAPRVAPLAVVRPPQAPLPPPDQRLSAAELDEAWRHGVPGAWSAQRVAAAVLDVHDAAMTPDEVLAFVGARSQWSLLRADSAQYWHAGFAVRVRDDGRWELDRAHDAVRSARVAVRERIAMARRWEHMQPDAATIEAPRKRYQRERAAHAAQLARMRRVLVHAFPAAKPEALVLVDVAERAITTFMDDDIAQAVETLAAYDIVGAVGVRALLRALGVEPGARRLAELGPPQKTLRINRRGRTLAITTALLVQGSCGISRPLADARILQEYLRSGDRAKLRRRLEADAKSLYALYQYGRLHGGVRVRWGFLDEMLPAPWVHRDEPRLYHLLLEAHTRGVPLEVVVGSAPGWADPWSRALPASVATDRWQAPSLLVDEQRYEIPRLEVQQARLREG